MSLDIVAKDAKGIAARKLERLCKESYRFKFDAELRRCRKDASMPSFRKLCCRGVLIFK